MYESPIEVIYNDIANGLQVKMEKDICEAICSYGINVNRDELIKALAYDRNQYEKGYSEGSLQFENKIIELFNKYDILLVHIDGKIVPVKNSTKQECYNLLYEIQELIEWRKLLFKKHLSEVQDENND